MSTASLRPVLRPSTLPSLPPSSTNTTYICQSCRHARLLRRPKRPYTFTQLVTLSDGSAFTMRTTSPLPVYRSTRDTRNAPLWNPSSKELMNVEDDEAGRLAGFRARFGSTFDAQRNLGAAATPDATSPAAGDSSQGMETQTSENKGDGTVQSDPFFRQVKETKHTKGGPDPDDVYYDFEEDDANLIDLISSYGQETQGTKAPLPAPAAKKGKK